MCVLSLCQNLSFVIFWRKKWMSLVKLAETCLISSAIPLRLSAVFLRSRFQIENTGYTILCNESRLRADLLHLRFILSCRRLTSSPQCMLSIDQCLRTNNPNFKQLPMKNFRKLLHSLGHIKVVYPVFHTAKCWFRRHTIAEHTHLLKFV